MIRPALRFFAFTALALVPLLLDSCSSTKIEGIPEHLPEIALTGSTATPPHSMQSYEYPFDSHGNYVSDWAAEGERRSGRSAVYSVDDEKKWGSSHGGSVTTSRKSSSKTTSKSKKSRSSDDDPPAKKKSSTSSASKGSGSTSYTVKSSDTLYAISRKFGVSVERIKQANGLKSNTIRGGMTLKIPK